jgi:hypothetical protein
MNVETWKAVWYGVLLIASLMFYAVCIVVAIKGMADFKQMIGAMLREKALRGEDAEAEK